MTQNARLGQIWCSVSNINLIFVNFGDQLRENTLILNIPFGNDDLVPNFGPTIEVLSNFMKFGTKNKWNILIDILIAWTPGKFHFKIEICCLVIHKTSI